MVNRLAWIVAVTTGLAVGGFVLHFPGSYGAMQVDPGAGVFGFLLGAVNGLLVGALASPALRLGRAGTTRLLGAMALVVGSTHGLNDGAAWTIPFVVIQAVAGLAATGVFAWRFGERRVVVLVVIGAAWTGGIVLAGWSGDRIGLPLTETPVGWAQDHLWDGLVTGLVWSTATAAVGLPAAIRSWRRPTRIASIAAEPA